MDGTTLALTAVDGTFGLPVVFVGQWARGTLPMERAVGQEFASAFLSVLYPHGRSECATSAVSEREASYRRILEEYLEGADTDRKKDQLAFGLYSVLESLPL